MRLKFSVICFVFIVGTNGLLAQREQLYSLETAAIIGTEQTPFWMRANQWGLVPLKGQTLSTFAGIKSDYFENNKAIKLGYGANIGGFVGMENRAIIQEAYLKAKWKVFEAYTGRRKEIVGLVDSSLSSGSYIWSGNALPMPKIEVSMPEYTSFKKGGFFAFKGNYAHGWFNRNRNDAKGLLLHQKSFYFRLGKPKYKLKFYAGFNHQVQWGGYSKYKDTLANIKIGDDFGNKLNNYLAVVTGRSSILNNNSTNLANDSLNRVGNHLGSLDVAIEMTLPKAKILVYRQSIFEDGSLFYLNNITDGMHGLSISFGNSNNTAPIKINKVVLEFLNTLSQGGPYNDNPNVPSFRGNDNYMNNGIIRDGWTMKGTSIGSPFFLARDEFVVRPFKASDLLIGNNRFQAIYMAASILILNEINILAKYSNSRNWGGSKSDTFTSFKTQNSFFIQSTKNLKYLGGFEANLGFAFDYGDLLDGNLAIRFGVKKVWSKFPFSPNYHPTHRH
jgi:hypothetical protein